ncbi:hypothetical protein OROGR_001161 [Orobanche gracilis]
MFGHLEMEGASEAFNGVRYSGEHHFKQEWKYTTSRVKT